MGLTAAAVFVPNLEPRYFATAVMIGVFAIVTLPCIATWAALGATLKRWLTRSMAPGVQLRNRAADRRDVAVTAAPTRGSLNSRASARRT
jgi:hypothetical protein